MIINDRGSYVIHSTRTYDEKGYLKCHARVARSGIQSYYGMELGMTDKDKRFKLFKVYRPDEVVFNDAALADYLNADITNDHPGTNVNSKNYAQYSKGTVISVGTRDEQEPNFVQCDLLIKDEKTIKDVEAGKVEISAGYDADLEFTPGVIEDSDEHYDAIMRRLKLNHVAIVKAARAGKKARIGDSSFEGKIMDVSIGSVQLELNDELGAAVKGELESMTKKLTDADHTLALKDAEIDSLKAKVEDLKEELEDATLTDEQIKQLIQESQAAMEQAKALAGEKFVCDSVVPDEIKKAALEAKGVEVADKSADWIDAYFDASLKFFSDADQSHKKAAQAIASTLKDGKEEPQKCAEEKERDRISNAWKNGLK